MILNLGSYKYPIKGFVNVDISGEWPGVDVVCDLNTLPWPFADGSATHIRAVDILEYLGGMTKLQAVGEMARVLKYGGTAEVRVPLATNPTALQSLQHAHVFYLDTFQQDYAQPWFRCERRWVSFFAGRIEVPFVRPWRPLIRLLCRMVLGYCVRYYLVKTIGVRP